MDEKPVSRAEFDHLRGRTHALSVFSRMAFANMIRGDPTPVIESLERALSETAPVLSGGFREGFAECTRELISDLVGIRDERGG